MKGHVGRGVGKCIGVWGIEARVDVGKYVGV